MRRGLLLVIALIATITTSSAYAVLSIDPVIQKIDIGEVGTYTVTLYTDATGVSHLKWKTDNGILARIGSEPFSKNGNLKFDSTGGEQTFTLEVMAEDGVELNKMYDVELNFNDKKESAKAKVTGSVVPVPELSTIALMSAGLLGMIALVRRQRRD